MTISSARAAVVSYRRSPDIFIDWRGGQMEIFQASVGRRFAISPEIAAILDAMTGAASAEELAASLRLSRDQVDGLVARMAAAGVIVEQDGDPAAPAPPGPCLGTYDQAAYFESSFQQGTRSSDHGRPPSAQLPRPDQPDVIPLPYFSPRRSASLHQILDRRRSIREYSAAPIRLNALSAFLADSCMVRSTIGPLSAQTSHRASPSAGARHSLEIYVFARHVDDLERAIYYYDPFAHELIRIAQWNDRLEKLQEQLVVQPAMLRSAPPVSIYITSVPRRVSWKYGSGALSLIYRDTGCLLQTMYLVATDLRLAPCALAALDKNLTPDFLAEWRGEMVHVGSFALGRPAEADE